MKIAIGCDHRGYELKHQLIKHFEKNPITVEKETIDIAWVDVGCDSPERCDYPVYAHLVACKVQKKDADYGILICGSGIGMVITANRYKGIYAALCWSPSVAQVAHEHDAVNILALASDFTEAKKAIEITKVLVVAWATKSFKGGRYQKRLDLIEEKLCS